MLSILMPVRNEAAFLGACLASITPPVDLSCEVVLVDDGSTDATLAIAQDFAQQASFPVTILHSSHRGKAAALNLAFSAARGDSFILLAGDDLLVAEALSTRVAAVAGDGPRIAQCRYQSFSDTHPERAGVDFPRLGRRHHPAGGAVSFNRSFAARYFPIPEHLPNEDTWLRAVVLGCNLEVQFVDRLGLRYRIHPGNAMGPLHGFAKMNLKLRRRHAAFTLAMEHFAAEAHSPSWQRLAALARAESLRAAGRWGQLLVLGGLEPGDRMIMLANSTAWLFGLKKALLGATGRLRACLS